MKNKHDTFSTKKILFCNNIEGGRKFSLNVIQFIKNELLTWKRKIQISLVHYLPKFVQFEQQNISPLYKS